MCKYTFCINTNTLYVIIFIFPYVTQLTYHAAHTLQTSDNVTSSFIKTQIVYRQIWQIPDGVIVFLQSN